MAMLKDRFLTFLPPLLSSSDSDLLLKPGCMAVLFLPSFCLLDPSGERIIALNGKGRMDVGDSGEELGDGSVVTEGESKVEAVVVGDESVESEVREFMLLRCCSVECG